jgi:HKD family nuclease
MLVLPPSDSLAAVLCEYLTKRPHFGRFEFAVAWARLRGVELIGRALEACSGHKVGIVGLNQGMTSYEALYALYERLGELWVFYKHPLQTFHPKIYLFAPSSTAQAQRAVVVIGSSNLTAGGLATNFEACWLEELDLRDLRQKSLFDGVSRYLGQLLDSPFCHRVRSVDFLKNLLRGGYVRLEKSLRARARRSMGRRRGSTGGLSLPEAPPAPLGLLTTISVPSAALQARGEAREEGEISEEAEAVSGTVFYVRTLTRNDVLKALGHRPGTWEPDLGLTARNEHPGFWGWPHKYTAVHRDRREWRTKAKFHSRLLSQGITCELCLWFRPERPKHPAEHRFRPAARVKERVVPPEFDTEALTVVQRLPEGQHAVFRVDFILSDDPQYPDYAHYLTTRRPGHRFGYGFLSQIEY